MANLEVEKSEIKDYERSKIADEIYEDFYKEKLSYIKTFFVYVNSNNEINKIREDSFILNDKNIITKEELMYLIKNNEKEENTEYRLLSLLSYNIDLEPSELKHYIENENLDDEKEQYNFLKSIKVIEDIEIKETITLLHDLNSLYFIYYQNNKKLSNQNTKKIYINNAKNRKTRRKQLKAIVY